MGTFADFNGIMDIPEDKKELFTEQMMKVLYYGGMMSFDEVKLHGHKISLLCPVKETYGKEIWFHYNYFEDTSWESAGYKEKDHYLWSGKVGSNEFLDVMAAAYTLYEIYSNGLGTAEVNGDTVDGGEEIGWLNQILGTSFTREKRLNTLWKLAEQQGIHAVSHGHHTPDTEEILALVPDDLWLAAGGTDLTDLLYIANGTEDLCGKEAEGTYPADIYHCKMALKKYFAKNGDEGLEPLWSLLKLCRKKREETGGSDLKTECNDLKTGDHDLKTECSNLKTGDHDLKEIAGYTCFLPARVIIYLTAELQGLEFWGEWKKLKADVYQDETRKIYANASLEQYRAEKRLEPVPPVRTSDYLRQDDYFTFYNDPKELKGKPNYYLSDADRLYWWDDSDEVMISDETDQWLKELGQQYQDFLLKPDENEPADFLDYFLKLMEEINEFYARVFPFQDMFYDFLQHNGDKKYLASLKLLEQLSQENREEGKIIQKITGSWDLASYNVTHNPGRMRMKRYLAFLANQKLREKYFGF